MASLHDRFRTLDRAQAPDLWPEMVQRASTAATPVAQRGGAPALRLVLLLAALLVVAAAAMAAVGAVLRTDRTDPDPFPLLGPISTCDEVEMAENVSLWLATHDGGTEPFEQPSEITAYNDGRVIRGPSAFWGGSFNSIDAAWSTRRLEPEGLSALVGSVAGSVPTCRRLPGDDYTTIQARTGTTVHVVGVGPDLPFETRVPSNSEVAAMADLLDALASPAMDLSSSAWADADWEPYVPERWRMLVSFSPLAERDYPPAEGILLPDGSALRDYGAEGAETDASGARCFVVSAAEASEAASAMRGAVAGAGGEPGASWSFADDEGYIHVSATGLLPHEPECDVPLADAAPSPSASAGSVADAGTFGDACDYLDPLAVGAELGEIADVEHGVAAHDDWHTCWYPVAGNSAVVVSSSRRDVPSASAAEQAQLLFGELVTTEEITGREVYFNGCGDASCRSAMAVSAAPHFVVVTWIGGETDVLRDFAEHILERIDSAD